MSSLSFSDQISALFNTFKGDKPQNSSESQSADNLPVTEASSENRNSDVFILLNAQQCEFNIGLQNGTFTKENPVKKEEPSVIVIDSDDEDSSIQVQEDPQEILEPPTEMSCVKEEETVFPDYVIPIQSVFLPEKHFLSGLTERMLPEDSSDYLVAIPDLCELCGKATSAYVKDNQEDVSLCTCSNEILGYENYLHSTPKPTPKNKKSSNNKLSCPHCNKKLASEYWLKMHCAFSCKATKTSKLRCKMCSKSYAGPVVLVQHMNNVHDTKVSLKEVFNSDKFFKGKKLGINSLLKSNMFNCSKCEKSFVSEKTYDSHFKTNCIDANSTLTVSENEEVSISPSGHALKASGSSQTYNYICRQCDAAFSSESALLKHCRLHPTAEISKRKVADHSASRSKKICNINRYAKSFNNKKVLKNQKSANSFRATNILNVFKRSGYSTSSCVCPICGKYVYSPSFLKIHLRKHTNEKPFNCKNCGKGFFTKVALKYHSLTKCPNHVNNKLENELKIEQSNHNVNKDCSNYGGNALPKSRRNIHSLSSANKSKLRRQSEESNEDSWDNQYPCNFDHYIRKKSVCENCDTPTTSLKRHSKFCKGKPNTEICSADLKPDNIVLDTNLDKNEPAFISEKSNANNIVAKKKEKKFKCRNCKKSFNGLLQLKRHDCNGNISQDQTTTDIDEQETSLRKLLKTQGNKTFYVCPYCGKKIVSKYYLPLHLSIHTTSGSSNTASSSSANKVSSSNSRNVSPGSSISKASSSKSDNNASVNNSNNKTFSDISSKKSSCIDYSCKKCGKQYRLKMNYDYHVRVCKATDKTIPIAELQPKTQTTNETPISKPKEYKCDNCSQVFRAPKYLLIHKRHYCKNKNKRHPRITSGSVSSNIGIDQAATQVQFKSGKRGRPRKKSNLSVVMRAKADYSQNHTSAQPVVPLTSTMAPNTPGSTLKKIRDKCIFICGVCQKEFHFPSALKAHINRLHTECKIVCKSCNGSFNNFEVFKSHLSGGKSGEPIRCNESKETDNTRIKNKSKSKSNVENVFSCNVCACKFPTIPILVQHLQEHMLNDNL